MSGRSRDLPPASWSWTARRTVHISIDAERIGPVGGLQHAVLAVASYVVVVLGAWSDVGGVSRIGPVGMAEQPDLGNGTRWTRQVIATLE